MSVVFEEKENNLKIECDLEFEKLLISKVEDSMTVVTTVQGKDRSLNIGVIGSGQAGNKIAKEYYDRGYPVVLVNTAMQDLKLVEVPDRFKIFLDSTLGGSAKDIGLGREAAEEYRDAISDMINENLGNCDVIMVIAAGGGGTGSGSIPVLCDIASKLGKPVVVKYVLPMASEDAVSKNNTISTLHELTELAKAGVVNSLFVVDNAKIETIYHGLSLPEFWKTANNAVVEPIHLLNKLSSQPSPYSSMDPMEFGRVMLNGGFCLYGMTKVEDYEDNEIAIAEAIVNNLHSGLLADGFDLTETRVAGVIMVGSEDTLKKIPSSQISYGFSCVNKESSDSATVYKGIYQQETGDSALYIYSIFGGLGLPRTRVDELKAEAETHMKLLEQKNDNKTNMTLDLGKTKVASATDQIYNKIKAKSNPVNKLLINKKVNDLRRR